MNLNFGSYEFSKRFDPLVCAVLTLHDRSSYSSSGIGRSQSPINLGRTTAAAIVTPEGNIWTGLAFCNPNDRFIKKVGKEKAIGRAFSSYVRGDPPRTTMEISNPIDYLKFLLEFSYEERLREANMYVKAG